MCVTHDIDEAIKLGDRICILREGAEIAQYDTPENILANPANHFVEDFVGAGSSLKQLTPHAGQRHRAPRVAHRHGRRGQRGRRTSCQGGR